MVCEEAPEEMREPSMDWLPAIERIAREAGKILLAYKEKGYSVTAKSNPHDMVTEADIEADALIRRQLSEAFPGDKILSEESESAPYMSGRVWVVDPLDGTDCYVRGDDGFAVLIGLCVDGVPEIGLAFMPSRDELYFAEKGKGAFLSKGGTLSRLRVSSANSLSGAKALVHVNEIDVSGHDSIIKSIPVSWLAKSSGSMDQMRVAKGDAEFFINFNRSSKWDVCATQVILEEAGGRITTLDGGPIDYMSESVKLTRRYFVSNRIVHDIIIDRFLKPLL
jgi:3'(2'),5'-bisphosphate nucleotidase